MPEVEFALEGHRETPGTQRRRRGQHALGGLDSVKFADQPTARNDEAVFPEAVTMAEAGPFEEIHDFRGIEAPHAVWRFLEREPQANPAIQCVADLAQR